MYISNLLRKQTSLLILGTLLQVVFFMFVNPHPVLAHEVYVLDQHTIDEALKQPPLQVFSIVYSEEGRFFFWFFLVLITLSFVGVVSLSKRLEALCDPFLLKLREYAPLIGRLTLASAVLSSAYHAAIFGPELPMTLFLPHEMILGFRILLGTLGTLLFFGIFTRISALLMAAIYGFMIMKFSAYMLTYLNYLGEIIIAFTVGGKVFAVDTLFRERVPKFFEPVVNYFVNNGFFMLRIAFGTSLIYAAVYAKLLHAQLAIDVVTQFHLTNYFHFDPPFLVLGALGIELLLGTLFIIGFEVRFAAIFLTIFLTLSLLYFGESVWPHIILVGGALTIFANGYGRFTLEREFLIKLHRSTEEPVL